mmetsp:Transcript_6375/g.13683  ORF Transcript_6375/g.13683 Transcript_6375/m.13683 type:complete len:399 (-) Transcript_6375:3019-4215(-)
MDDGRGGNRPGDDGARGMDQRRILRLSPRRDRRTGHRRLQRVRELGGHRHRGPHSCHQRPGVCLSAAARSPAALVANERRDLRLLRRERREQQRQQQRRRLVGAGVSPRLPGRLRDGPEGREGETSQGRPRLPRRIEEAGGRNRSLFRAAGVQGRGGRAAGGREGGTLLPDRFPRGHRDPGAGGLLRGLQDGSLEGRGGGGGGRVFPRRRWPGLGGAARRDAPRARPGAPLPGGGRDRGGGAERRRGARRRQRRRPGHVRGPPARRPGPRPVLERQGRLRRRAAHGPERGRGRNDRRDAGTLPQRLRIGNRGRLVRKRHRGETLPRGHRPRAATAAALDGGGRAAAPAKRRPRATNARGAPPPRRERLGRRRDSHRRHGRHVFWGFESGRRRRRRLQR